jgi:hypothetical protein
MRKLVPCSPIRGGQFVCISKNAINILKVYTVVVNLAFQQHNTGKKNNKTFIKHRIVCVYSESTFLFFPLCIDFSFHRILPIRVVGMPTINNPTLVYTV